jgi:hypothetical protein
MLTLTAIENRRFDPMLPLLEFLRACLTSPFTEIDGQFGSSHLKFNPARQSGGLYSQKGELRWLQVQ